MKTIAVIAAAFSINTLSAVTIGPNWCVAYPECKDWRDWKWGLRVAAEEVRDDINEATGMRLKAVPASQARTPAIYIGAEFAKRAGFDLSGLKWYDNVIAEKGGNIYLFGNDMPGRDPAKCKDISWFRCVLPSVKASTRFLETAVGVRFLMPGVVGKEVPRCREISLKNGSRLVERPSQIYGSGRTEFVKSLTYMIANGVWGMGAFHSYGGHSYPAACPAKKYFETHPEYFGLLNGKRSVGPTVNQTPLCISNPEVEQLMVDELKRKFDEGARVCQLGQNDGSLVCQCEKCRAMYGTGDDWGEKFWCFHRHIAERMLKERPGKIVHILSYAATGRPPKTFREFPANVMVELCRYSEREFAEWKKYKVPQGFTAYTYLCGNYVRAGFVARRSFARLAQLVKMFHDNNVLGVFRCSSPGDLYGTEGPGYYVFNRLLLDGSRNVDELLTEYCTAAFGPAAADMRRFYDIQDTRMRMFDKIVEGFAPGDADGLDLYLDARPKNSLDLHGLMFSPETTAEMEKCLSSAERQVGLLAKQRKRLELVRLEFDYAKNLGAISTFYSAYRLLPTKETIAPLLREVVKRNEFIERLFGGKDRPMRLQGWPELQPFGGDCTREYMDVNGRMNAAIKNPLKWDAAKMLKYRIVPGEMMTPAERADEMKASKLRAITGFDLDRKSKGLQGLNFELYPDGTGFKLSQGTNRTVRVIARVGAKHGLRPGRTYRISWITRWENVTVERPWFGYSFSAVYGTPAKGTRPIADQPENLLNRGTSPGWMRESLVMTVCDKPGFVSEFIFRLYNSTGGTIEVRDVAIEEVEG